MNITTETILSFIARTIIFTMTFKHSIELNTNQTIITSIILSLTLSYMLAFIWCKNCK
jgi:hypothetical protein